MTDQIAYQEHIQYTYNAFCKTVIRCAAIGQDFEAVNGNGNGKFPLTI